MEHRRVDIHGHMYQWYETFMWEARVVGGSDHVGKLFDDITTALDWVQDKPHFMLVEVHCVKAIKVT